MDKFLKSYSRLILVDLRSRFGVAVESDYLTSSEVRFLIQTASMLSFSEPSAAATLAVDHRAWAYDVSTRLLELYGKSNQTITEAVEFILSRLGNFPGRDLLRSTYATGESNSVLRAVGLRLEAFAREAENTIEYPQLGPRLLTDFQLRLYTSLKQSKAVSVSGPTSAGKSFVLAHDIVTTVSEHPGSVLIYLVPTRALIQQVTSDLLRLLREAQLSDVVVSAAPIGFKTEQVKSGAVYVLTQERLISLLSDPDFQLTVNKVYVDEAQGIGDVERGLILDSAIRQVLQRFPSVQTCFASPLTKNPGYLFEEFDISKEGEFFTETLAPVSQLLVNLEPVKKTKATRVTVATPNGIESVGEISLPFKFRGVWERLAETAKFVRQDDESVIIFANRPHDAMEIAEKLADIIDDKTADTEVVDLIDFVKTHVHPRYSLADALVKGVAFHYGRMPHVIRSQVEEMLRTRKLSYVVSTSTLLQGVNLPARHIVVLNPKQGNKTPMQSPDFWNLVGRAGRLRENFRGIVWCIDPSNWEAKPLEGDRLSEIKSAFQSSLQDSQVRDAAIAVLDGSAPVSMVTERTRVEQFIGKAFCEFTLRDEKMSQSSRVPADLQSAMIPLEARLEALRAKLKVPEDVCKLNAVIAPTLLNDLWERFSSGVTTLMTPVDPFQTDAINHFRTIFQTIDEVFIGSEGSSWKYFATLGYFWVRGHTLRDLIDNRLQFYKATNTDKKTINRHIRDLLDDIELTLRFTYVKYLKAYNDVLRAFWIRGGKEQEAQALAPWDLYVEFGARDRVLLMLMSIGISRTTAILIRKAITNQSDISREECWAKLQNLPLKVLALPNVCKQEIRMLTGSIK